MEDVEHYFEGLLLLVFEHRVDHGIGVGEDLEVSELRYGEGAPRDEDPHQIQGVPVKAVRARQVVKGRQDLLQWRHLGSVGLRR